MTTAKTIIKTQASEFRLKALKQQMHQIDEAINTAGWHGEFSCMYVLPGDAGEIAYEMIKDELEKRKFKIKLKSRPPTTWWSAAYKNYTFKIIW